MLDTVWAVIWENGLAESTGKNDSIAILLNNNRDMVLWNDQRSATEITRRVFLLKQGKRIQLGEYKLGGKDKRVVAINAMNDRCQLVGWIGKKGLVLWENEKWHILQDLIPPRSGWVLETANDINESGQIIGNGKLNGKPRAFLLTPISQSAKPKP